MREIPDPIPPEGKVKKELTWPRFQDFPGKYGLWAPGTGYENPGWKNPAYNSWWNQGNES
jgi:hypothetical protein